MKAMTMVTLDANVRNGLRIKTTPDAAAAAESILADDDFLRQVLSGAELPALMPALAHATGDLRFLPQDARPRVGAIGAIVPPQGGMSEEEQDKARQLAFTALQRLRDSQPEPLDLTNPVNLTTLMTYITGPVDDDYVPLMVHELGYPVDTGKPAWQARDLDPNRTFRVAVIGAGMSGIAAAHRLNQAGIDVVVFEKNPEVGGTWYENAYPGCRLDTTNFGYSYSFAQTPDWPQQYSPQQAIFEYFAKVADQLGVRKLIRFNTKVEKLAYDETSATWRVTVNDNPGITEYEFDAVVSAVGQLNRPNIPDIPGRDSFDGNAWHTAQWDHSVDLSGRRVAVIGTGASAFQVIPQIAADSAELKVFQRTPPWILPAPDYQADIKPESRWLLDHVPFYHRWYRFYQFWTTVEGRYPYVRVDPTWSHPVSVSAQNEELRAALHAYLTEQFADRPDLLRHVVPSYPPGAKRMLRDDGTWARTLKRDNVELVTSDIERIEPAGIRTSDGKLHEVDVIVYGTGFRASEFLMPMTVKGQGGVDLHERWGADVRAFLGITLPDFPNLFCLYGPNTNLVVNGSIVLFSEMATEYIIEAVRLLIAQRKQAMEVKQPVFDEYNRRIDAENQLMAWGASGVSSWYKSATGRVSQNWPLTIVDYWRATRHVAPEDYVFYDTAGADADQGER